MLFWNKICGFTATFFLCSFFSSAQISHSIKLPDTQLPKPVFNVMNNSNNKETLNLSLSFAVIPQDYYTQHFGIICKKELAFEKATKIPFRFRLGSLQQCNYLEEKR
ncbi:MAG: hypothetical protein JWN83_1701 [Chitinophagaceae bacterium]|nr:hypothetical protein [Ferruginibacter sp.]MDB5223034.1 hypothetical protein [Chitinophagaceae bacterium]